MRTKRELQDELVELRQRLQWVCLAEANRIEHKIEDIEEALESMRDWQIA